ncbi:O-antigen ligase family protein [Egicoccus sp. AB-alg2]|uniref:O-antigen ligase family protein n=1 Tax=Egicoccus sp. AB-alg2 TaxID=3242693 RepID=UPI00359E7E1B
MLAAVLGLGQALLTWTTGGVPGTSVAAEDAAVSASRILVATVPYATALAVVVALRRHDRRLARYSLDVWATGLALAGVALAAWLLVRFAVALPGASGAPYGFYRLKLQITSPLGDHNTAAGLLLPPLVAAAVLAARNRRWLMGVAVLALGTTATLSRGVAVVLAGTVLLAAVTASRRRVAGVLVAAFVVVVVGLTAASVGLDTAAPPGTAAPGPASQAGAGPFGTSVLGRVDLAVRGVEVGRDHPVVGIGLGRFAEVADDLPQPNDHAHQAFAHAFAEGGVLLLAAALVVVATLAWRALTSPSGPRRDLVLLGGAGLVAHAQVEILAGRLGYEVLLALLVGLAGAAAGDAGGAAERGPAGPAVDPRGSDPAGPALDAPGSGPAGG